MPRTILMTPFLFTFDTLYFLCEEQENKRTRHRENKGCHATPERVLLRVLLRIFNSGVEIRMWGKIEYILDNLMLGYK